MMLAPKLQAYALAAAAIALVSGGTSAVLGYRLGSAAATREAVARIAGERDSWKGIAEESLKREREWLATAGGIQARWEGALDNIRALQLEKPKTVREVIREGQTCPDVSVDPDTFRVLDAAVISANAARDPATP